MSKIEEKEGKIISKKGDETHYYNSETAEDIKAAHELLERTKKAVRNLSRECPDTKSLRFRYRIGLFLADMLKQENISSNLRRMFWEEVQDYTDAESLLGIPGSQSSKTGRHPFLEYCYLLAVNYSEDIVFSFSWHQWNDIFDRPQVMKEPRIITWLSTNLKPMNQNQFRFFLGIATFFINENDPTFFDDEELSEKCILFKTISICWDKGITTYFNGNFENVSEARRNNKSKYRKKYVELCFEKTLFVDQTQYESLCLDAFVQIYVNI